MGFVPQQEQVASGIQAATIAGQGPCRLTTVLTRTCRGVTAAAGVPGSPPRDGQLVSVWAGRDPGFLLLRAAPDVTGVTAVLASGDRRRLALSPVIEDLGLRFAATPLPEDDPLAAMEAASRISGTRTIEMWRPPKLARPPHRRRASGSANHSPANRHVTNPVIRPAVRPLET